MQASKSLATLNPSYVHSRFSRVEENITLRRSEWHSAQILHCNLLKPDKANDSFKRAVTDLLNGFNISTFDISQLYSFKRRIRQVLLERDTQDWETRVVREGIVL